jgi:hypothetical protein
MIMNDKMKEIYKDVIMGYFKVLSWHFPEEIQENHKNLSQDNQSLIEIQTVSFQT